VGKHKARKAAEKARKQKRREHRELDRAAAAALLPPPTLSVVEGGKKGLVEVSPEMLLKSRRRKEGGGPKPGQITALQMFQIPRPAPGVVPKRLTRGQREPVLAMDQDAGELSQWAGATSWAAGWFDGPTFMGYPALSLLAVLPEYRRMAEVLATECTREWIRITAADSKDQAKLDKVTALNTELERLDIRGAMRRVIELDAFFGRAHLFVDVGTDPDDRKELETSIGNGRNPATTTKFEGQKGFLRGVKPIEPVWCYPAYYNATNPLKDNWYAPQIWYCQAQSLHVTRLLRFVGREVPDLLKPSYMFGGVSLSQLMKPYVDRWITTVQAVTDIIVSYSTTGIRTNLSTALKPGQPDIFARVEMFSNLRSNLGTMVLDKDTEEFFQFNVPLSELEALMSKMQEFLCSMSGEPVVKLLGIQPAGLNASSDGELTSWLDWCEAFRSKFCSPHLTTIIDFAQLSLFGEVDPDISWGWVNLRSLNPKEEAEQRKVQAETDATYVEMGAFDPMEIRQALLADPESPYFGLEELVPDTAAGATGEGAIDPDMAAEFPGLAAPAPAQPALTDQTGQEDPRAQRRGGEARPRDPEGARPTAGPREQRADPEASGRRAESGAQPRTERPGSPDRGERLTGALRPLRAPKTKGLGE
jgi:phage-related protein (TIGR01555 family)